MEQVGHLITTNKSKPTLSVQSKVSDEDRKLWLGIFRNQQRFLLLTKPQRGYDLLSNPLAVWMNKYPTLRDVIALFPEAMYEWKKGKGNVWYQDFKEESLLTAERTVNRFLATQIGSYLLTTPQKVAPTAEQLQEMTMQCYATMQCYTVAEIMIFFALMKTGKWDMYNKGNIQEVLEKFRHEFQEYRAIKDEAAKTAKRDLEYDESLKRCVTYEQAKEMARQGLIPPMKNQVLVEHLTNKQTR